MKSPRDKSLSSRRPAAVEHTLLQAELPGAGDRPLLRLRVEMRSEPQAEGERLRLRAHVQMSLGSATDSAPVAAALGAPSGRSLPARRAAALVQRSLASPLLRRLAAPLLRHDLHSWLEINASTAPLADGARALMPSGEHLARLGVELPAGDGPLAQTWASHTDGPRSGVAQFSLLRLDKRHLPPALAALLGTRPFQFAAALASVVERHEPADHR